MKSRFPSLDLPEESVEAAEVRERNVDRGKPGERRAVKSDAWLTRRELLVDQM